MIRYPWLRYSTFRALLELDQLAEAVELRPLTPWDCELHETFGLIEQIVTEDPYQSIGAVLFDRDEAKAFADFRSIHVDYSKLTGPWPEREAYVTSEGFRLVLTAAANCINVMLGPGRGIPGWASTDEHAM